MLKFIARLVIGVACFYCIALLIQHTLVLRLQGETSFEAHIEQIGAALLAGVALGIACPFAAKSWFYPALLAVGGSLALLHYVVLEDQMRSIHLLMSWLGAGLGLLIMGGLYRSWAAMYDKHLVAWGGPTDHAGDRTEEQ
jgi:hypothetical protein